MTGKEKREAKSRGYRANPNKPYCGQYNAYGKTKFRMTKEGAKKHTIVIDVPDDEEFELEVEEGKEDDSKDSEK
jgi:hypothetical protein